MARVVEAFAERAPDPYGGRVYRRLMTSLEAAPDELGWGGPAVLQARAAARIARARWRLPVDSGPADAFTAQLADDLGYPVDVLLTYQAAYAVATSNAFTSDGSDGHFAWCIDQLRRSDITEVLGM